MSESYGRVLAKMGKDHVDGEEGTLSFFIS